MKYALTGLLLAFAVVGGLFTVALVAVTTIAVFLIERFHHRTALSQPPAERRHDGAVLPAGDAIDVVATEVDEPR